ncbi:MAG: aminotransferase class I/II-fold pyridoxal phosphate-dependent enzyme [Bacillota bacterium]
MSGTPKTPVIEALKRYTDEKIIRFHMPGHKGTGTAGNKMAEYLGQMVFKVDVTNIPGLDDLHQPEGVIREAQELAALTFGSDRTYFLVNGSSCGLQALVMTLCGPGEKILVPRNIHRSILSGIILSGSFPVYYRPEYNSRYNIPMGILPETIERSLKEHPDIKGVLLVNPTYHGITSDIPAISAIVHEHGIPLVVDEAHGPHLYFSDALPQSSLEGGADAVVQGTHKILPAFTQASMLHLKGTRINRERLAAALRMLQSTSTSYLLIGSLDAARAQMETLGRELTGQAVELSLYIRSNIEKTEGIASFAGEIAGSHGVCGLDLTKVTISLRELGVSGPWAEKWLRENCGIQVEMSDVYNLLLIVGFGNSRSDADRLMVALGQMIQYVRKKMVKNIDEKTSLIPFPDVPELVATPREAFYAPVTTVQLAHAANRTCAEIIASYPPGIPVICPGEKISPEIIEHLVFLRSLGMHFQGCNDASLETIQVLS